MVNPGDATFAESLLRHLAIDRYNLLAHDYGDTVAQELLARDRGHRIRALRGAEAGRMWRMLCECGKDLKIEFRYVQADEHRGKAHWEAWFAFSATGKKVHNVVEASFEFRDGKIIRHTDQFDFRRWAFPVSSWAARHFSRTECTSWRPGNSSNTAGKAQEQLDKSSTHDQRTQ